MNFGEAIEAMKAGHTEDVKMWDKSIENMEET